MTSVEKANVVFVTNEGIWGLCGEGLRVAGVEAAWVGSGEALLVRGGQGARLRVSVAVVESSRVSADAMELVGFVKEACANTGAEVIVLGSDASAEDMLAVVKAGACDYIPIEDVERKPDRLCGLIARIREERQGSTEETDNIRKTEAGRFVGRSPRLIAALRHACSALKEDTVLLQGESGSGKSFLARTVVEAIAPERVEHFVRVDCGALADSLLESELFGWRGGSFSGAGPDDREGFFERADGGVLFLDEIGNLEPRQQKALLVALEGDDKDPFVRRFHKIGGGEVTVNAQIIAATHYDLPELVKSGGFLEPLYYRLAHCCVHMPPLRERQEDIPHLAERLLWAASQRMGKQFVRFSEAALEALARYPWPGNVRELSSVISGAVRMNWGTTLELDQLPPPIAQTGPELTRPVVYGRELVRLKAGLSDKELERLAEAFLFGQVQLLDGTSAVYCEITPGATGNVKRLAEELGVSRNTLTKRLKGSGPAGD